MANLSIQFLGGAGTVTGSKYLLQAGRRRFLIDCGLFQGLKELRLRNWAPFPVDARSIDALILTHAHLDHCGAIPLLARAGFTGPIYCTPPTADLARLVLLDAARIEEDEAHYANEMGYSKHRPAVPLFSVKEARASLKQSVTLHQGEWRELSDHSRFRFRRSGHILGSSFVEIDVEGARILFTGDLGREKPLIYPPPELVSRADILVIESTYGDRLHSRELPLHTLGRVVDDVAGRRGHLIIPSFAVGRTQEVLYLLSQLKRMNRIPDLPVYLDSPMGIEATEIFLSHPSSHRLSPAECRALSASAVMVRSAQQSEEVLHKRKSSIVIAGSGMLTGGRVLRHLEQRVGDKRNCVLLTGYQAIGTRGRLLRDGAPEIKMHGEYYPVGAEIREMTALSAHADQTEIMRWLQGFKTPPKRTLIVHGEPQAAASLKLKMRDALGWESQTPQAMERIEIGL